MLSGGSRIAATSKMECFLSISSFSLGPDRIYVNWTEIQGECKNGIITGHALHIYQLHDNGTMNYIRTDRCNSTATAYIIKMLSHGINYTFTVASINGAGLGGKSLWNVQNLGKVSKH